MKVRALRGGRVAGLALSAAVVVGAAGVAGVAAGPAGASHKKKHHATSSSLASKLKTIYSHVSAAKGATYTAVYTATYGGKTQSLTFAQQPPKSLFKATGGEVVDNGTETLFCSTSSGAPSCLNAGTEDPLAPLIDLLSATNAEKFFQEARGYVAAKTHGYTVTFSSMTVAGQASQCGNVTGPGGSFVGEYCVANAGFLTYAKSSTGTFKLTSFSKSVSSGEFTPPAGATVETLPAGVTIPSVP